MRIHSNTLTYATLYAASKNARVEMSVSDHGSRKRVRAFDVTLTGESRRRPNSGQSGAGDDYAATWDQWGVFLSELYNADSSLVTPYYDSAEDFSYRTADRFADGWPDDAHGDHRFERAGSWTSPGERRCFKCSAICR